MPRRAPRFWRGRAPPWRWLGPTLLGVAILGAQHVGGVQGGEPGQIDTPPGRRLAIAAEVAKPEAIAGRRHPLAWLTKQRFGLLDPCNRADPHRAVAWIVLPLLTHKATEAVVVADPELRGAIGVECFRESLVKLVVLRLERPRLTVIAGQAFALEDSP